MTALRVTEPCEGYECTRGSKGTNVTEVRTLRTRWTVTKCNEGYDRVGPFEVPEVRRVRTRKSEYMELLRSSSAEDLSGSDEVLSEYMELRRSSSDEGLQSLVICGNWAIFPGGPIHALYSLYEL
jgi:hypothetical protein